uniref:Antitoxin n=1 Tax=Candidatus Kentrum sp. FW TaxID=2126338 RepID=A0A450TEX8_9GAMM|nr:MAG: antitoxin YefM [Candidatus Kentron sp. FW]
MENISVNRFRDNLKSVVEQSLDRHQPFKVTRRGGEDFVVIGAQDWEREQETLFVLQNTDLMRQIKVSMQTHTERSGYIPTDEEIDEIIGVRG